MDERTEVHGYVNTCPDDQMHESVTHRCTACGQPFHENTADGGRAKCTGSTTYVYEQLDGPAVLHDSTHAAAGLRPIVRRYATRRSG